MSEAPSPVPGTDVAGPEAKVDPNGPLPFYRRPFVQVVFLVILALGGGSLYLWRTPRVFLTTDGQTREVHSHAKTVGELLADEKILLAPEDRVSPPPAALLQRDLTVRVTRIVHQEKMVMQRSAARITWQDRTRANLRRALVQRGQWTEVHQKVRLTLQDGQEVARDVLRERRIPHSFFTLTLFNNRGFPVQKYDLLKAKTLKMLATGYYVGDPMVPGDTTFLGHKLQRGLVAVDPKVIPLRSRLYIPGYGYAYASDTGSAIKGMRIDLAVKDKREERRYNHRKVTVYVLEKARTW